MPNLLRRAGFAVLVLMAFVIAAVWCFPAAAQIDRAAMNKLIDATNVLVDKGCSGTVIDAGKGLVLTAAHCILTNYQDVEREHVDDNGVVKKEKVRIAVPGKITQYRFDGPNLTGKTALLYKLIESDRRADLALLQVAPLDATPAPIACRPAERGDPVYAVGNSFGILYSSLSAGIVANVNRSYRDLGLIGDLGDATDDGEHGLVQHTATIAPGNSGGALYDEKGKLVGVNVRGIVGGFGFAVPLADVRKFLGARIEACPS